MNVSSKTSPVIRQKTRRVLVFAYYFPPMGLSGVQRTAKFLKYLPRHGWESTVVTCRPHGYFAYDDSLLREVEEAGITIRRAASLDPTRLFGKRTTVDMPRESVRRGLSTLSQWVFVPDNKVGWIRSAFRQALAVLEKTPCDLIYSSAPPYSSHLAAARLARKTGLPLVLDFRDDWVGNPRHIYPTPWHRARSTRLEGRALKAADRVVVIGDAMRESLAARHPDILTPENVQVIPQGFDPADFDTEPRIPGLTMDTEVFTLLYSGVFYDAQSPEPFLRGLAALVEREPALRNRLRAVFMGLLPAFAKPLAAQLHIEDMIHHTGYLPHEEAVSGLLAADALWMTIGRAEGSERTWTGKLYEYFGSGKPVLGLVPEGVERKALKGYGASTIVEPDAPPDAIADAIGQLYEQWSGGRLPHPDPAWIAGFDRERLAGALADIFNDIVQERE